MFLCQEAYSCSQSFLYSMDFMPFSFKNIFYSLQIMIQTIRAVFKGFPDILIVTIFGSAVTGITRADSDIDIAVAAEGKVTFERKTDIYLALLQAFNREIDLVDLNEVNGIILKSALCSGEIVIKRSVSLLAELLKKMWYNQADMMPLTTMIMEHQIHRFIHGQADCS